MKRILLEHFERLFVKALETGLSFSGYRSRFISTSVGRVHLLEARGFGQLPPLVLVHGLSGTGTHYMPLFPALRTKTRRLVIPDLLGHGRSDMPAAGSVLLQMEQGLIEALDSVIAEPAFVFGNSLGGAAALRYALVRPAKVRALILCSPGGAQCGPEELAQFLNEFRITTHAAALEFVDRILTVPGPLRQILALSVRTRFGAPAVQAWLDTLQPGDLFTPDELGSLSVPTLLIWGRDDRVMPRSQLEYFRRNLPPGTLIEEPEGVAHTPYLQAPGVLTRSMLRFMHEIEARRAGSGVATAA